MAGERRHLGWLDAARGIGILLVVYGHVVPKNSPEFVFVFSFHMPLFFFLAGVASALSRGEDFVRRRAVSRLAPYVFFGLAAFLWDFVVLWRCQWAMRPQPAEALLDFVLGRGNAGTGYNGVLWFLPCLLAVELLFRALRRRLRSGPAVGAAVAALFLAAYAASGTPPFPACWRLPLRLPLVLDSAMAALAPYAAGAFLARVPAFMEPGRRPPVPAAAAALLACLALSAAMGASMDYRSFLFLSPVWDPVRAGLGIAAVAGAAKLLSAGWLERLGRASLAVMCLHNPVKATIETFVVRGLLGADPMDIYAAAPGSAAMTAVVVCCCLPLAGLVEKRLPMALGKISRKRP